MLEALFGNRTAEKVLIFIAVNRDAYAKEISVRTGVALNLVQRQLQRLERGGILVSRPRGRMRFYSLNPQWAFVGPLKDILLSAFDYLPDSDRAPYVARRRPRMQGKAL